MRKVTITALSLAFLSTLTSAGANRVLVHGTVPYPAIGAGYQWGDTDAGALRLSGNLAYFLFIPGLEVQADYLHSFGEGSHFYGGAGVGGTFFVNRLDAQARAFVGAQTRGEGIRFYAEGGGVYNTMPYGGSTNADGTASEQHFAPYAKLGMTFPVR